jgi:nucleoid-associated protein YgaU
MGLFDFMKKGVEKPVERKPAANTPRPEPKQPGDQPIQREYTIKSGDSLSKIAKQYYGSAADWEKIYQANKDQIKNPNLIHPGQKIKIP